MRLLTVFTLLFSLACAPTYAIDRDKELHYSLSTSMTIAGVYAAKIVTEDKTQRVILSAMSVLLAGALYEAAGNRDKGDMEADILGVATGATLSFAFDF